MPDEPPTGFPLLSAGRWIRATALVLLLGLVLWIGLRWRESGLRGADLLARLQEAIRDAGCWAPLLCIALYAVFTLLFIPTTPLSLLVGVTYGPVRGTVIASAGTTLGVALAFLAARHLLRAWLWRRCGDRPLFHRINEGVRREGWRIIVISRMLPITPYNFLNYAYGLTRVSFTTYLLASWAGMLPPTAAVVCAAAAAGDALSGQGDWRIGAGLLLVVTLFVAACYAPRWRRRRAAGEETAGERG